jgi:L-ascorbate metabolism protein UlaG (beta-lactamase superfamily)
MDITYLGHSAFKLRGKNVTVVTDPYSPSIGLTMPKVSADVVTISHEHDDHNEVSKIMGTARRVDPYIIKAPGEYEVSGVGVFGWGCYHDKVEGKERGRNTIYVIHIDGVKVAHLGDLGHMPSNSLVEDIGEVDVVLVPVGGEYTINAEEASEVASLLQAAYIVPMHYKVAALDQKVFGNLQEVDTFAKVMGLESFEAQDRLSVNAGSISDEEKVVVLKV